MMNLNQLQNRLNLAEMINRLNTVLYDNNGKTMGNGFVPGGVNIPGVDCPVETRTGEFESRSNELTEEVDLPSECLS